MTEAEETAAAVGAAMYARDGASKSLGMALEEVAPATRACA